MLRTYKYRLYPTPRQKAVLADILAAGCELYNHALAYRRKKWRESRKSVSYYEQAAMWRNWRNEDPGNNPLRVLNMSAGQQVLRRLDAAYREFLKGRRGRPRFKPWHRFNSVNYKPGDGSRLKNGRLYVQNVGLVRVRWHRELPEGRLKNIILVRRPSGWYVCLQVELPDPQPEPHAGPPVGIDIGLRHALALSDGQFIDSPRHLQRSLAKLRVLQRTVERRQKGSQRWKKAVRQVARQHERIANQRRDFWHKITRWLVDTYGAIALEELSLQFMLRNGHVSRAAHDTALGIFYELLAYKAVEAGCELAFVDPRNTTQMCSGCSCLVPKDWHIRVHACPHCGLVIDRDINAALNILSRTAPSSQ